MSRESTLRLGPVPFIAGGALLLGVVGLVVDLTLGTGTAAGPLSGLTAYNFTLLGAVGGAILGAFAGFGLI